jgi:hypothetical protein
MWKASAVHSEWSELETLNASLRPELLSILRDRFCTTTVSIPTRYSLKLAASSDLNVFRATFFFQEDAPIARWRSSFMCVLYPRSVGGAAVGPPAFGIPRMADSPEAEEQHPGPADNRAPLEAIVRSVLEPDVRVTSINFLASAVAADFLRRFKPEIELCPEQLIRILTETSNIHEYVERETILGLLGVERFTQSHLLVFLLRNVLFRKDRTQEHELDRRAAFMALFAVGGRDEIVPFLDAVARWSPQTARYVAQFCTRTFLERLYLLVESVKEVVETRIAICKWILANSGTGRATISEERDALERELANLDARSDLDSTRVHVDEDSLREWYNETQRANELRYRQTVITEGVSGNHGTFLDFYNRSREQPKVRESGEDLFADAQIGSEFILLSIFEATLTVFVTDKTFGLDSYLSRRIRHGTLRGFLTTPVARVRRRLADDIEREQRTAERESLQRVAEQLDRWFAILAERLDYLRREVIQIASDRHPVGLIEATWRTPTNVRHLDAMMARTRARVIGGQGDDDVFSDVYLLCWDFLERDLAQLRLHLNREFYKNLAAELIILRDEMDPDARRAGWGYWIEIASLLNGRVQEICGWFIRPVFRRNAYDLRTLVESTISIVRELDESYRFEERVDMGDSLIINRGSFDVLGDILFVLIGNAAKHGKRGGLVLTGAEAIGAKCELIAIEVVSEVENSDALLTAQAAIRRAKDASDLALIQSAGVIEGFSGIRKVIGLLNRVKNRSAIFTVDFDPHELLVRCRVVVPSTIAFARERT